MKYLLFFLLCLLQPICLPVPEATTILSGTIMLGPNKAFFIALTGILIGIIFMYKITAYLSKKYLTKFKKNPKYKTYKKFVSTNPFLTTGILFAVPILPDEIVCIGAAIGGTPLKILLPIAVFAKTISIGMITYSSKLASMFSITQWQIILIEISFMLLFAYIYNKVKNSKHFAKAKKINN